MHPQLSSVAVELARFVPDAATRAALLERAQQSSFVDDGSGPGGGKGGRGGANLAGPLGSATVDLDLFMWGMMQSWEEAEARVEKRRLAKLDEIVRSRVGGGGQGGGGGGGGNQPLLAPFLDADAGTALTSEVSLTPRRRDRHSTTLTASIESSASPHTHENEMDHSIRRHGHRTLISLIDRGTYAAAIAESPALPRVVATPR